VPNSGAQYKRKYITGSRVACFCAFRFPIFTTVFTFGFGDYRMFPPKKPAAAIAAAAAGKPKTLQA